jgi:CheY-like chemotaxis protein
MKTTDSNQPNIQIMLVDDEPFIISTLTSLMSNNYQIVSCSSGNEAWDRLQDKQLADSIQLVISDQRMPGISGTELLSRLKSTYPGIRRFLLSGNQNDQKILKAVQDGTVETFLPKPFSPDELLGSIKEIL